MTKTQAALEIFDRFCRFIDGLHMGGFVENDFMTKKEQETIRTALKAQEWQDIGTAPRDGTVILVPGGTAYWYENKSYPKLSCWKTLTGFPFPGQTIQWEVKHWQPLPQPPDAENTPSNIRKECGE